MKRLSIALPAGLALGISGFAAAQTSTQPGMRTDAPHTMQQLDANHDGSISPTEAQSNPALSGQFLLLDINGDGALEPAEFARFEMTGAATTRGTPGTTVPPPMGSTPPPMGTTPPPNGSTPPPMGSTPPPR